MSNKIHEIKMHIMNDVLTDLVKEITFEDLLKECNGDYDLTSYVQTELMESRFIKVRWTYKNKWYISRLKFFNFERDGLI